MDVGWNFRREHLRLAQRSHYVITERRRSAQRGAADRDASGITSARPITTTSWTCGASATTWRKAATLMTDTTFTSRLLGSAWPGHFNKPIAEAMYENIKKVGLPQWSEDDQKLAKGLQKELKVPERGLPTSSGMRPPRARNGGDDGDGQDVGPTGGGSDDIGDVSWNVPTITLRYPSNIPGGPGTTGPTRSPWRRRSRIKAWSRARRCRP